MSWRSRSWRILKRVLVAVAALVLVLLLLVSLTLGTRPGRNLLLAHGLTFVNDAIPGRIQVVDFKEFSFTSLELGGIAVFDPAGTQVLTLRTLRVEGDWLALRADDLRVTRARLHDGFVDVSTLDQERRGLVAAFVDPDAPPSPPSTTPPPYVLVKSIELDALTVRLPRPSAAVPDELRRIVMRGSFELDGTPRAQVESLTFDILRGAKRIGRLTRVKGRLGRGNEASNLTLAADLAGVSLDVSASGVAPPASSWQTAPLKARVKLVGATSERIARLAGDDSLGRAFLGEVELDLDISGTTRALAAKLALASAAGELELQATLADSRDLRFELEAPGLVPSRLLPGAPAHTVAAELRGRVDVSQAPSSFRVHELKLSDASIDGEELPRLDAAALVSQRDLKQLKLEVADAASHLVVTGDAGFDGSAKLDVTAHIHAETLRRVAALVGERRTLAGTLSVDVEVQRSAGGRVAVKGDVEARKLVFDTTSLGLVAIKVDLAGQPPELSGGTQIRLERLVAGDTLVSAASLDAAGRGNTRSPSGLARTKGTSSSRPKSHVKSPAPCWSRPRVLARAAANRSCWTYEQPGSIRRAAWPPKAFGCAWRAKSSKYEVAPRPAGRHSKWKLARSISLR